MDAKIIPVIHNVSSVQKLIDMAKLSFGFGYKMIIISKAYGSAAQNGIAEVFKIALKEGKGVVVLPDLKDALELYNPKKVILIDKDNAKEEIDIVNPPVNNETLIVFNGSDSSFSPNELTLGEPYYIKGIKSRIGSVAEAALILYSFSQGHVV
ncbi:RecB-family nuclease [Caldisphaera lagunensis DSM 15908]|uniref:RecB-family nuclease n=1 Tax=Caldisphaera lagunensis (strain DSM 15908 / JCM 11604 / ANMR 0165 / IC-154) TaxID=1056495 RepID=L0ABZ5_CALLD|nr:RecB-family nuclease [Caldisphaera lagunensis]AFZ70954.1 RecB-family nuclease [Caldisphaera lagunensis DSM 15908]